MQRERLQNCWKVLLALYLFSFVLPVGETFGAGIFLILLIVSAGLPGFFLYWVANPLFWFGLSSLRRGHHRQAALLGCMATLSALLPFLPLRDKSMVAEWEGLSDSAGYFVWLASIGLLAATGLTGWLVPILKSRPQMHIRTLMIVVLAVALVLAGSPALFEGLRWLIIPEIGLGMPGFIMLPLMHIPR